MARKSFLLRMDPALLAALQGWAEEDFRSLNGQIEFLLKQAVVKRGMKIKETDEAEKKEEESK
jgi:hypothetical protein